MSEAKQPKEFYIFSVHSGSRAITEYKFEAIVHGSKDDALTAIEGVKDGTYLLLESVSAAPIVKTSVQTMRAKLDYQPAVRRPRKAKPPAEDAVDRAGQD